MYSLVGFLMVLRWVLFLPVALIQFSAWLFTTIIPGVKESAIWEPHTSRPSLRTYFKAEGSGHNLTDLQKELFDRILAMERLQLSYEGVSKPLNSIETLDAGASLAAVRANLGPKYFQRYLVTAHTAGTPIGYVTAADLVTGDGTQLLREIIRTLPELSAETPFMLRCNLCTRQAQTWHW